jgi:hypothetical protein
MGAASLKIRHSTFQVPSSGFLLFLFGVLGSAFAVQRSIRHGSRER